MTFQDEASVMEDAVVVSVSHQPTTTTTTCCGGILRIRPRLLFSAVYVWLSLTGGRFTAPLLQDIGLTDSQVGTCLALSSVIQSVCSSAAGALADARERRYPGRGRANVLQMGVILGTLVFLLEGLHHIVPPNWTFASSVAYHFVLRSCYAIATSIVFPVLDGITLDYLNRQNNNHYNNSNNNNNVDKSDYGTERLGGAIWWAITHMFMGPSIDQFRFSVLYVYAAVATIIVIWIISIYTHNCLRSMSYNKLDTSESETETENSFMDGCRHVEEHKDGTPTLTRQKSHTVIIVEAKTTNVRTLLRLLFATAFGTAFMIAVFCLAMGMAPVESLIFLYFEVLGSSYTLCAGTVVLTVAIEIPIFAVAPKLLKHYGSTVLLLVACFCYITRVVGYSLVPMGQPYLVLLFEPLHGITYACATLSSVEFVAQLVPDGYEASGQGMLYAFRASGNVVGLLFGGIGEDLLGPRTMYRILAAVVTFGFGVLGLASLRQYHSNKSSLSQIVDSEEDPSRNSNPAICSQKDAFPAVELVGEHAKECP